jgi:anion-transporting  ArsA/GET3 family ATPase
MGGVGKTTADAALAEAQRHELVVWWVRAEQPSVLVNAPAGGT